MSDCNKVIEIINHYQDALNRYVSRGEEQKILHCLNKLRCLPITVSHLEETGIGRTVNSLRKVDGDVGEGARTLVNQWKEMVEQDTHDTDDQESDKGIDEAEECAENEKKSSQNEIETINVNSKTENEYSNSSEKEHSREINCHKSNKHKGKDKHEKKYNESSSKNNYENTSSNYKSNNKSSKRKHEENNSKYVEETSENSEDSDDRKKRKDDKYDKTYKEVSFLRSENKCSKDKSSTKKSDNCKEKTKEGKDKNNRHRDKGSTVQSPKINESSNCKMSEKQSSKEKKKRKNDGKKENSNKSSKKEETHKSDKGEKRKESSQTSKKDKHSDLTSSITFTARIKNPIIKEALKNEDYIDSGSGASFAEALGMLEPLPTIKSAKKKLANIKNDAKKNCTKSIIEEASTSYRNRKSSPLKEDSDLSDENNFYDNMDFNDVPTLLSNPPKLDPLEINISSLLPTITPNYRPIANNPLLIENPRHKLLSDYEHLSNVITSKNARTKVYSGNKLASGTVPSLFELCTRILMDNIDAIEYTGGIPFMILKPILDKCTPEQLMNFEHYNAYVIEDTDDLWNFHCQKEFRTKKREEWESWREMYIRCLDEREAKLRVLTANIKQSQDKTLPVRQTKLAYVDSVVKPPRGVARKQLKNCYTLETKNPLITPASRLSAITQSGSIGQVSVPNPGLRAAIGASSNAVMKMKKAPLMQKTLQLMKGRFRR